MVQTAVEKDIERQRGDTFPFTFTFDNASKTLDITGSTFTLTVDPSPEPPDAMNNLFALTGTITETGPFGTTGNSPQVEFTLTAMQADQTPAEYYYDFEWTDSGGFIRTVAKGKFTFEQDISK